MLMNPARATAPSALSDFWKLRDKIQNLEHQFWVEKEQCWSGEFVLSMSQVCTCTSLLPPGQWHLKCAWHLFHKWWQWATQFKSSLLLSTG